MCCVGPFVFVSILFCVCVCVCVSVCVCVCVCVCALLHVTVLLSVCSVVVSPHHGSLMCGVQHAMWS